MNARRIAMLLAGAVATAQPADAERLALAFMPPDLPPSNVCNAPAEEREAEEIQEVDSAPEELAASTETDIGDEGLQYLVADIKDMTRDGADRWFDFIQALITRRAELDPHFAGAEETFARIDLHIAAGRLDELSNSNLIAVLAAQSEALSNTQKARLARLYLSGLGIAEDREKALGLIVEAAHAGNGNALMELLRLQLAGVELNEWELSLEDTATLAFGGLIGRLNRGLCDRAERMAREYIDGEILATNLDLAYAWRKFAADMGGASAAWRVVEHQLNATGREKDNEELAHYLRLAVENRHTIDTGVVSEIVNGGATTEAEIRAILSNNYNRAGSSNRRSAVQFLRLEANPIETDIAQDSSLLRYLREVAEMPGAPGPVYTRLAKEILLRRGRWAGEAEAIPYLEEAIRLDDPEAMSLMAEILLRQREDPKQVNAAEALLTYAVSGLGHAAAMKDLDRLYRCQHSDSPRLHEAQFWSAAYLAADIEHDDFSETDLARLDATRETEAFAKIQTMALRGHGTSIAHQLQMLQSDALVSDDALRYWAGRVSRDKRAIEDFALAEYELALTPEERESAIELARRAYLHLGPAFALDLAVTLVEHAGRSPEIAAEIEDILSAASRRGEGAAIRLLQRLTAEDGAEIYRRFAEAIENRGDFLALMYAVPYVSDETFERYMNRAISIMNCSTKDVGELADAYTLRHRTDAATQWLRVGLSIEGGNVLSRLGLSRRQMAAFDRGPSPLEEASDGQPKGGSDADTVRRRFLVISDPGREAFDPSIAGEMLADIIEAAQSADLSWALAQYRRAHPEVRNAIEARLDIRRVLEAAAEFGDSAAQFELGMLLRREARDESGLAASAAWLEKAAERGHYEAMTELGFAIGFGLGRPRDPKLASIWLERASRLGGTRATELSDLLNAAGRE